LPLVSHLILTQREATLTLDAPLGPALTALAGRLPDR
jgi:hypothetical protein